MGELIPEVARFQEWADAIPPENRNGEWECAYGRWDDLYDAVLRFVGSVPFASWTPEEVRAVLYAVSRDNEMEHLASEIRSRQPEKLVALAEAAVKIGARDAKWEIAEQLGQLRQAGGEAERLLLILAHDEHEYVRRRSLQSLARLGSRALEELALAEWHRPDEHQQWARMGVLWCLHRVRSSHLGSLLVETEKDERQYLSEFARKVQRGEVDP